MSLSSPTGLRRECRCGRLLAVQHGAAFHLRYRELHAVVTGELEVRCTRCHTPNRFRSGERSHS